MTETDGRARIRRRLVFSVIEGCALVGPVGAGGALYWAGHGRFFERFSRARRGAVHAGLVRRVVPFEGYQTRVSFGESIVRLVAAGRRSHAGNPLRRHPATRYSILLARTKSAIGSFLPWCGSNSPAGR